MDARSPLFRIRAVLIFFILALLASGITAFPLVWEVTLLNQWFGPGTFLDSIWPAMSAWIATVHAGLLGTQAQYLFMFYGTDWLAFAHIMIALAFWGPLRDPIRNIWVIEFGMIACVLVIPLALICGPLRGIPFFWQLIDCSFGVIGIIPLALVRRWILRLEQIES